MLVLFSGSFYPIKVRRSDRRFNGDTKLKKIRKLQEPVPPKMPEGSVIVVSDSLEDMAGKSLNEIWDLYKDRNAFILVEYGPDYPEVFLTYKREETDEELEKRVRRYEQELARYNMRKEKYSKWLEEHIEILKEQEEKEKELRKKRLIKQKDTFEKELAGLC